MKTAALPTGRALIVALDHERIAMSLRTNDGVPVGRVIPAPAEHAARLRAIAWLAGNLARDQVTPIVAEAPLDMPSLATIPPTAAATPPTEPPALAVAPPVPVPPGSLSDSSTLSMQAREARSVGPHFWTIGVADGPTTNFPLCSRPFGGWPTPCAPFFQNGTAWRAEVQRRSTREGFFQGAALEGTAGSGFAPQLIGASAFVGSARRHGKWVFESTIGAGLELSNSCCGTPVVTSTNSSSNGFGSTVTTGYTLRPALFADGAVALVHPVAESLDAVLRVAAHLSTDEISNWFFSSTLGLRYNLL
jgi:hypothetical protein